MKLDTDKERAMTPEFIEQQRPLFEAAFAEKYMKGCAFNFGGLDVDRNYFADWVQDRFDGWLLARSAGLSQEPVAHVSPLALERIKTGELSCCAIRSAEFVSNYPGETVASVPLYSRQNSGIAAADVFESEGKVYAQLRYPIIAKDGDILYTAPPAPVSVEPVAIHDALRWSKANRDYHGYIAFTPDQLKLFVSHIQSAPAAPLSDAKDREFISEEDFSTLFHFNEQAQDSEADGYTASKEEMKRLAELGVVQSLGFGRYGVTSFGSWLIEKRFEQDTRLPLRTGAEHEKREHDAWKAYCEQMKSGDTAWVNLPNDVRHQWHERAAIAAAKETL